ncbi:MAG: hypothetical protein NC819_02900 [Candidatus Omnitrophica bacterium]|nr:hypothetical protein [Candidatus Omnitrophota bacterium]
MDRKLLIDLFQKGMKYAPGRHRFWISRCFEIHVRSDRVVELDEYEGFDSDAASLPKKKMFHVGRSVLNLKNGRVVEKPGTGWGQSEE